MSTAQIGAKVAVEGSRGGNRCGGIVSTSCLVSGPDGLLDVRVARVKCIEESGASSTVEADREVSGSKKYTAAPVPMVLSSMAIRARNKPGSIFGIKVAAPLYR